MAPSKKPAADVEPELDAPAPETPIAGSGADLGVPMAEGDDHQGPEDALAEDTRGDYSGRLDGGPSVTLVDGELVPTESVTPATVPATPSADHTDGAPEPVDEATPPADAGE